jgi:23S rRNA pseudouridine955/2504/2580 synthase
MRHEFKITAPDAGRRLDRWLPSALGAVSFSVVRRLLRQKKVRRNGNRARAEDILVTGDDIVVHLRTDTAKLEAAPADEDTRIYSGAAIEVLLEDPEFVFLAKPAGVSCSDDGLDTHALALWLREHFAEDIAEQRVRPEPCHRLDRGTTGIVVVALTAHAHELFRRASQSNRVRKLYEVAVWGEPPAPTWNCTAPLRRRDRARGDQARMIAATAQPDAQSADTRFSALACANRRTLLAATLGTGRTHQIRAHCLIEGLPVIHDPRYGRLGDDGGDGPMLHARSLTLELEDRSLEAQCPWPQLRARWLRDWSLLIG